MNKEIIRKIKEKVLKYEDVEFNIFDKKVKITFDFPESAFFAQHIKIGIMTNTDPYYFDIKEVLPIYRNILKNGSIIGEYKLPMYDKNPNKKTYQLKEDVPFDKYPSIKFVKDVPYLMEGNVIRPLKYEIVKQEKKTSGFLLISIEEIEREYYTIVNK